MLIIMNSYRLVILVFACKDLVSSGPSTYKYKWLQSDHSEFVISPSADLFSLAVPCLLMGSALIQADHPLWHRGVQLFLMRLCWFREASPDLGASLPSLLRQHWVRISVALNWGTQLAPGKLGSSERDEARDLICIFCPSSSHSWGPQHLSQHLPCFSPRCLSPPRLKKP